MITTLLAKAYDLGPIGGDEGFGPWGFLGGEGDIETSAGIFTQIISNIIGIMTIVAGIWFVFMFIIAAFGYLTAGGDKQKISESNSKITTALIGLVVVVFAYALISLLENLLGFKILQPQELIEMLGPGRL